MVTRTAVVIGVNKTGGLAWLNAAVSGARTMNDWLTREGFEVKLLDDEQGDVTVDAVKKAVRTQLDANSDLEQIVIYFAGHGYLNGTAEIWLLSGAPDNPDEAIDQTVSAEFARSCSVPSVTFISDACRSNPPSITAGRVSGSSIFPNRNSVTDVDVDRFFATRPGDPALEMSADAAREVYFGLFTETLHTLHHDPEPALVRTVVRGGRTVAVVPCRKLKDVIADRVDALAQTRSITLSQRPQLRLECGDDAFLAKAEYSPGYVPPAPAASTLQWSSIRADDRSSAIFESEADGGSGADDWPLSPPRMGFGVEGAVHADPPSREAAQQVIAADAPGGFESRCGAQVTGALVDWAVAIGAETDVLREGTLVRVRGSGAHGSDPPAAATTLLLGFADGSGTAIAALPNYVASVLVDAGRVVNVSYVPSEHSDRWNEYQAVRGETESLRSIAAAAARNGILTVDRGDAKDFADKVRRFKIMDPTLGIYAAFAYAEVGRRDDIVSILNLMRADLRVDLFDVALLADPVRRPDAAPASAIRAVPFGPMLSQNWSFLRARSTIIAPAVTRAGIYRRSALWTTFEREGLAILRQSIETGELK